jgi:hypothetical protein
MLDFLPNKTFYDTGIDIPAGEVKNHARFGYFFTLRESRRTPYPALQRIHSRRLRLTVKPRTGDCPGDYLPYWVENEVPIGV